MKKLTRVLISISLIIISVLLSQQAFAELSDQEKLRDNIFVIDNADIMSEQDKLTIYDLNKEKLEPLENKPQLVIYTTPSLKGQDITQFATEKGRELGIGDKEQDTGMLLVFAVKERKYFFATGYGTEGIIPDSMKSGLVTGDVTILWKKNQFSEGIVEFSKNVVTVFEKGKLTEQTPAEKNLNTFNKFVMILIIIGLIIVIVIIVMENIYGGSGYSGYSSYSSYDSSSSYGSSSSSYDSGTSDYGGGDFGGGGFGGDF